MAHYFVFALDTHFLMENLQYICKSLEHRADSAQRDLHLAHLATLSLKYYPGLANSLFAICSSQAESL